MIKSLREKLYPGNFTGMSPKMAAIVGYLLGMEWTNPTIFGINVTSDKFVIASSSVHDSGVLLGTYDELVRNWNSLLDAAVLTDDERTVANGLFRMKVTIH